MCSIGERIKNRRKELGLTQPRIKELTGISSGTMSDIENGKTLPAAPSLIKLSQVLACTIDWILTGDSPISEQISLSDVREDELVSCFQKMSKEDQEELLVIARMKADKGKGTNNAKLSPSEDGDLPSITA
ncbi:MAG: helix-turn-helix domain-containing protein [Clostridiales bacterium]|nr:helix-turn-helix domain-containing protein [Clostridiales bacterium]